MTRLEKKILYYEKQYRLGNPLISDKRFDEMFDDLPLDSILRTKGVIAEVPSDRKEKLPMYMGSMDKLKTMDEFLSWLASLDLKQTDEFIFTPKYDAISLLAKEDECLAWTRGDGEYGQQSKEHYKAMDYGFGCGDFNYTIGEAIIPNKLFEAINDERVKRGEEKFSNPRNLAAGLFNTSSIKLETSSVYFMRYGCDNTTLNKSDILAELNKSNPTEVKCFKMTYEEILNHKNLEQVLDDFYNAVSETFLIDGIIVEVNDAKKRAELGREANGNPASARAIKLSQWQSGDTVDVLKIVWEVSKQGELKPVIHVVPTEIGGVTISKVTAYNARYVEKHKIGTGAVIEIIRSGDVIPKHMETLTDGQDSLPSVCPSCQSKVVWDENKVELKCSNPSQCKEVQIKKIVYFFKKAKFEYFAENNIRDLYDRGYTDISSILDVSSEDLASFDGWGQSSAERLLKQVKRLKAEGMSLSDQLQAFDLFDGTIGAKTAQKIFDEAGEDHMNMDKLITIEGVSEISANSFRKAMLAFGLGEWHQLIPISYIESPKGEVFGDTYKDYVVCFSGVRNKDLEKLIESEQGKIGSGVSSKTTHLIVKDLSEKTLSSSKAKKAAKLGIKITTVEEFKKA